MHATREMAKLALWRQIELAQQFGGSRSIPVWIERFEIGHVAFHRHPAGQLLTFCNVTDLCEITRRNFLGIVTEYFGAPSARLMNIHEDLERGALTCTVGSEKSVDGALGHAQVHFVEHADVAKFLRKLDGLDNVIHCCLSSGVPSAASVLLLPAPNRGRAFLLQPPTVRVLFLGGCFGGAGAHAPRHDGSDT